MALEQLTLTNVTDGHEYQMYPVTEAPETRDKPAFSVSPPGQSPDNNILLGIQGMQSDIRLQFAIWDDGTDRANGTYSSTVVTLAEQIRYLRDVMHAPTFSVEWTLDHTPGDQFDSKVYDAAPVYIERMELPTLSVSDRNWKNATMTLRRGGPA